MDSKKIIIVGHIGCFGVSASVAEAKALAAIESSGFQVVEFKSEDQELKELAERFGDRVIIIKEQEPYRIERLAVDMPFIPSPKIRSKYKRNLKYR